MWLTGVYTLECILTHFLMCVVCQVYSPGGRRILPTVHLCSPTAWLSTDGDWGLLVVNAEAELKVWDVQTCSLRIKTSLAPLLKQQTGHAEGGSGGAAPTGGVLAQDPSPGAKQPGWARLPVRQSVAVRQPTDQTSHAYKVPARSCVHPPRAIAESFLKNLTCRLLVTCFHRSQSSRIAMSVGSTLRLGSDPCLYRI